MKIQKKFRGKLKGKNEWIYGGLAYINGAHFVIYEMAKGLPKIEEVKENSVGQYSSVFDKNNIEMCEGDDVEWYHSADIGKDTLIKRLEAYHTSQNDEVRE